MRLFGNGLAKIVNLDCLQQILHVKLLYNNTFKKNILLFKYNVESLVVLHARCIASFWFNNFFFHGVQPKTHIKDGFLSPAESSDLQGKVFPPKAPDSTGSGKIFLNKTLYKFSQGRGDVTMYTDWGLGKQKSYLEQFSFKSNVLASHQRNYLSKQDKKFVVLKGMQ